MTVDRSASEALPTPDPEAAAQSGRLVDALVDRFGAGTTIAFDRFMEAALYHPAFGYYSTRVDPFGERGDFVTAPEVTPLFGQTLARTAAAVQRQLGGGEILELGAGSGALAASMLAGLQQLEALPSAYRILELSAQRRAEQQTRLKALSPELRERVSWLDRLPERPTRGVILANEVLDAMPVRLFAIGADNTVRERRVRLARSDDGMGHLSWTTEPADVALRERVEAIRAALGQAWPPGYASELNPALSAWIQSLAEVLEQGLVLLIDYGYPRWEYYHPQRSQGTLMCHYRQRAHDDPLQLVGLQDITAHVDFTAVAEAAEAAALAVIGFRTQGDFLLSAGITGLVEPTMAADSDVTRYRTAQALAMLTLPTHMGERFKVMALARGLEPELPGLAPDEAAPGWRGRDLRGRL